MTFQQRKNKYANKNSLTFALAVLNNVSADKAVCRNWCWTEGKGDMFPLGSVASSCFFILLLFLILGCRHCLWPGRKVIWYTISPPCFLIHTNLTSNPACFIYWQTEPGGSIKQLWQDGYTYSISECTSDLFLCLFLLPVECVSNHRACLTLLPRHPERPVMRLYIK